MRRTVWIFVVLFWAVLTVVYSTQVALMPRPASERGTLWITLTLQGLYYMSWAPLSLLIWRVMDRWDAERIGWPRFLVVHTLLAALLALVQGCGLVSLGRQLAVLPQPEPFSTMVRSYLRSRLHMQVLIYAAIVGTGHALAFHRRYRERQVAAARLEAQLAEARLETLRAQLQPHFLFNSLHSIASLARTGDNAGVVRLISGFSDLLRHLLDSRQTHHTVEEELSLVSRYLDLQRVRFGDRLRVSLQSSPDAAAALVPLLIVQPLVENALRHGLAPRVETGSIAVSAARDAEWLVLEVSDDGVGLPVGWSLQGSSGTGLRNLASRLVAEFGERQSLQVLPGPSGGVQVLVRLPYKAA